MIKYIGISFENAIQGSIKKKSDLLGAFSSGLCMIHCLATPFFFLASACSSACCSNTPIWWQLMDYFFLGISFIAVWQASKHPTNDFVIQGLWLAWGLLFFSILNIKMLWFQVPVNFKFLPAFALVGFHIYNMRTLNCRKNCC